MIDSHVAVDKYSFASGQLTEAELDAARRHSAVCAFCRERMIEMEQVGAALFLAYARAESVQRVPKEMRERFVARANREGIGLKMRRTSFAPRYASMLVGMALLVAAVSLVSTWRGAVGRTDGGSNEAAVWMDRVDVGVRPVDGGPRLIAEDRVAATSSRMWEVRRRSGRARSAGLAGGVGGRRLDFVMYSPKPKFSSYTIPTFSSGSGKEDFKPWSLREASGSDRAFQLHEQKPLLEAVSASPQPLAQYARFTNGPVNFTFNLSELGEQTTSH